MKYYIPLILIVFSLLFNVWLYYRCSDLSIRLTKLENRTEHLSKTLFMDELFLAQSLGYYNYKLQGGNNAVLGD